MGLARQLFQDVLLGIVPQLGELFHLLLGELVQLLGHGPHLRHLVGDVAHDVVGHVVVRVDVEARHLVPPLEAAVHVVIAGLPDDERGVPGERRASDLVTGLIEILAPSPAFTVIIGYSD